MKRSLLVKIIKRFFILLTEIVKEYHYLIFQEKWDKAFEEKSGEDARFININHAYWTEVNSSNEKGRILVEGFLAQAGNNYLLRTGMVAKAIQEKTKLTPIVIFDKAAFKSIPAKKKYSSFGIKHFIYIKPTIVQFCLSLYSFFLSLRFYLKLKDSKDILGLSYDGILIGDLIYDDILKFNGKHHTVFLKSHGVMRAIFRAFYYYFSYARLFKKEKISYLVSTHTMYIQYGMLVRVALRYGADVVETNDLMLNFLRSKDWNGKKNASTLHVAIKESIERFLDTGVDKSELINFAQSDLAKRFGGKVKQIDAYFAYKNKITVDKESLKKRLNIASSDTRPFAIIFSHVFVDAPHSSSFLLFKDYYEWFNETLNFVEKIKEVNWLIKPHPSAHIYKEEGLIERLVSNVVSNTSSSNVFLFPSDMSASNLNETVKAVVTVHGTAGIEFSCLGTPIILAGRPFYSGEGFTLEPPTKEAYFSLLKNIKNIPPLTSQQIADAKAYYGAYMQLSVQSEIITADSLDMIWGYAENGNPNVELGNKKINDNLQHKDPKEEFQYKKVKEYVESAFI